MMDLAYISRLKKSRNAKDIFFIFAGIASATIGLKSFLFPNDFLDGGAMGISLLLHILTNLDLSSFIVLINLPFILIGAKQISKEFAVKSTFAIVALAIAVHFIEMRCVTNDKLLISIFGGFFLGAGIGLTIRGGAVIDGTEVLAITVSRKSTLTVGDFITILNIGIFGFAIFVTNIETAMYSMLTYISASKTVDFIVNGIEEYIGVFIVSEESETIKHQITQTLGRGVTVLNSDHGYGNRGAYNESRNVLFCVVTRLETTKLMLEIDKIDPNAFVVQNSIKDTKGGMIKKRPMH